MYKSTKKQIQRFILLDVLANYNLYGKNNPHVSWDWSKAKQFYHDNYARYMGMIMEFSPNKEDAYSLIHREISDAAWTGY